jgi:peptide chain release factor 1
MFRKLDEVASRYERLQMDLQNPEVTGNQEKFTKLMKEIASLSEVVDTYRLYKKVSEDLEANKDILANESDPDLRQLAKEEMPSLEAKRESLSETLKLALIPKDPNDERDVILEIRAGAGGDEASLFAEELFRAYCHYASTRGWRVDLISVSDGNVGGYKEVIASISGDRVFSRLKYESGVHRVQRVPKTETQGRIHTSTITVAVLPEADAVDLKVDPNDIRIDVCRASGSGGQSVNTTDSAVRATHLPTGIMVYCQEGKSQHSNREKALKTLYSRLLSLEEEKAIKDASDARLAQIGTGDRSERIRTYNFPQTRITDHRIGLTIHSLPQVMGGDLDDLLDPILAHYQAEALKAQQAV